MLGNLSVNFDFFWYLNERNQERMIILNCFVEVTLQITYKCVQLGCLDPILVPV